MNNLRTEWKYMCDDITLCLIENKISKVLNYDVHMKDRPNYHVRSLYFDDINNSCLFDNDAGTGKRFKYRIRYYNSDLSYLILERKEKIYSLGNKKACKISLEQYKQIVSGQFSKIFWETDNEILKKFCIDMQAKLFRPKAIIDYERTAYVEPVTNVRITFDRNISGSMEINKFLNGDYLRYQLLDPKTNLLEIKYDDVFPSYIRRTVQNSKLNQITFSKYYLCREIIERS